MKSKKLSSPFPSVSDLSQQTRAEFENAGNDIEPIEVTSESEAEKFIEELTQKIDKSQEWDVQVSAINKGMALVNGGALKFDNFRKNLINLYHGLIDAATNLRSALLKQSCLFISQLARETGNQFDLIGDFIGPLSASLAHGTQVIADSCKFTIISIARNVQTRKTLLSIFDLCKSRGAVQRSVAAECLSIASSEWPPEIIASKEATFKENVEKLLSDASSETRVFARVTVKHLKTTNAGLANQILAKLDDRTKRAIDNEEELVVPKPEITRKIRKPETKIPNDSPSIDSSRSKCSIKSTASETTVKRTAVQSRIPVSKPTRTEAKKQFPETKTPSKPVAERKEVEFDSRPKRSSSVKVAKRKTEAPLNEKRPSLASKSKEDVVDTKKPAVAAPARKKSMETPKKTNVIPPKIRKFEFTGDEKSFLNSVKASIKGGCISDLQEEIPSIASNVLKCCMSSSQEISKLSLTILSDLLKPFSAVFTPALPKLMTLLLRIADGPILANARVAKSILNEMPSLFDPTDLVNSLMDQSLSQELISVAAAVSSNTGLSDEKLCIKLLNIACKATSSMEVKERHSAGTIIQNVCMKNRPSFDRFVRELTPNEQDSFNSFSQSYIPELKKSKEFSVPHYTEKNYTKWLQELESVCESHCASHEWYEISGEVFEELGSCIIARADPSKALLLAYKLIKAHGGVGFQKLFPALLVLPPTKAKDNIIAAVISSVGPQELCSGLASLVDENDENVSAAAIDILTRYISNAPNEEVDSVGNIIGRCVSKAIGSTHASVRKKSVLCFVELKLKNESLAESHISLLTPQQQKLIGIYYSKRCEAAK